MQSLKEAILESLCRLAMGNIILQICGVKSFLISYAIGTKLDTVM